MVTVDLQDKPQDFVDAYALANPIAGARAKVPLLQVLNQEESCDDVFLCESLIVAEYIAETYNVLLPLSAQERAIMRLFTELCGPSFSYFPLLRARGEKLEAALQTFREGLVAVNTFLNHHGDEKGPFLFGDAFSLAECNAAPFVQRACIILPAFTGQKDHSIKVNPLDICDDLELVCLKRWMEAVLSRPSVATTGVAEEELLKGTTRMLERFGAMEQK